MWIIYMIISMVLIYSTNVLFKNYGVSLKSYIPYIIICCGITGWLTPLAYQKAPSFFQPYFLSIVLLIILGFVGSKIFYNDNTTLYNYIGVALALIGSYLIVK